MFMPGMLTVILPASSLVGAIGWATLPRLLFCRSLLLNMRSPCLPHLFPESPRLRWHSFFCSRS